MKPSAKVYLIDTNVLLRYLLDDHPGFSPKAKAFMLKVSEDQKKAEILAVVIVECVYVMEKYYKIPKIEIVDTLSRILNFAGIVNPDRAKTLEALLKYGSTNTNIVDCMLAAHSSPSKIVISFDEDLEKLKAVCEKV